MELNKLVSIVVLAVIAFPVIASSAQTEIDACFIDKKNPPLVIDPEKTIGDMPGMTIDFLNKVAQQNNIKINFLSMPWARCLERLRNNTVDAAFHASFTKERSEFAEYPLTASGQLDTSRYLLNQTYYIYKRKDSDISFAEGKISGLEKPVGAMISFSIVKKLEKLGYKVEESYGVVANLQKLKAGRIDAFINLSTQTDVVLNKTPEFNKSIEKISSPYQVKDKYLIFSKQFYKNNKALTENIWLSLHKLREEGVFSAIEEKYIGQ